MAPGYLTDPFTLNSSVYDCHTCNCSNIPVKKYNFSLGQCKYLLTSLENFGTLSRNVYRMQAVQRSLKHTF